MLYGSGSAAGETTQLQPISNHAVFILRSWENRCMKQLTRADYYSSSFSLTNNVCTNFTHSVTVAAVEVCSE